MGKKFGYLFIQEILVVTKSSVRNSVCFLLTAKVELLEKDISKKIP